jgi:hypothetical protein
MESEGELQDKEEEQSNITYTKRSWVWNHFTFDGSAKKAQCNYCKVLISISKGSTSGMSNHMKSKHGLTKDNEKQGERQDEGRSEMQGETQKSIEISVSLILNFKFFN